MRNVVKNAAKEPPTVLATLAAEDIPLVRAEMAAIEAAVSAINDKTAELHLRRESLERTIGIRTTLATIVKGVSLVGGATILSGFVARFSQHIGFAITLFVLIDVLFRNHDRLLTTIDEKGTIDRLLETLDEVQENVVAALRLAGHDSKAAIKSYADFMQVLQRNLSKGTRAARDAARQAERDAIAQLSVSNQQAQPPVGIS
jgi:uncharacterized membrane protein YphA (DoxX/SURF4 family)